MKTKQPKNIQPWSNFRFGSKFSELKAAAEKGNLPALIDAMRLAKESDFSPKWLEPLLFARLQELLSPGNAALLQKNLDAHKRAIIHLERWRAVTFLKNQGVTTDLWIKASALLLKTTSDDSVKKSYYRVEKDMKDPGKRHLYYFPRATTIKRLGLPIAFFKATKKSDANF
jgi:hypothetical protein